MNGWGGPQWAVAAIYLIELGWIMARWGQPKEPTHVGWPSIIANTIVVGLLIAGGFWRVKP